MTSQEKAIELLSQFRYTRHDDHEEIVAKQCAIMCVQEIIIELGQLRKPEYATFVVNYEHNVSQDGYEKINFWTEVLIHLKQQ